MSFTMMCRACTDHSFIFADEQSRLRHVGIGHGLDGTRNADAARRDADHLPDPIGVDSEEAQNRMYERVVAHVQNRVPQARWLALGTGDQSYGYGFVMQAVADADGEPLLAQEQVLELADGVSGELGDLNWSERGGLIGEDDQGYGGIRL
jgi:hypothetical protein